MPFPARCPVVPLGEHLLQPLHDSWKLQAIRRLDIELKSIIGNTQPLNLEHKPLFRLSENPVKYGQRLRAPEQRAPVIDAGVDFAPYPLLE
jgi:hypothetical protein